MYSTFHAGGVAMTNAVDSSIAHTLWNKSEQIKEKAGTGKKNHTISVGIQRRRSKVGGK